MIKQEAPRLPSYGVIASIPGICIRKRPSLRGRAIAQVYTALNMLQFNNLDDTSTIVCGKHYSRYVRCSYTPPPPVTPGKNYPIERKVTKKNVPCKNLRGMGALENVVSTFFVF